MRIFSGIQPTGAKHLGNYAGGFRQYAATQEQGEAFFCIVDLHSISVDVRPRGPARAHARPVRDARRDRPRPGALDDLRAEPRDRARRGELAALLGHELRRAPAHDAVQGEVRRSGVRVGRRSSRTRCSRPATSSCTRPTSSRSGSTSASTSSSPATSRSASTRATARRSRCRAASIPRSARRSWTCRSPRRRCRRRAAREQGTVYLLDSADEIRRKFKIAVTDSGREVLHAPRTSRASRTSSRS